MYSYIPITLQPNNTFSCKIPVDSNNLTLIFKTSFNEIAQYWAVSLSDSTGREYIHNMPIIPGQNILEQFEYLGIGSAYLVPLEEITEEWPNSTNLGDTWRLVWGDTI